MLRILDELYTNEELISHPHITSVGDLASIFLNSRNFKLILIAYI